MPTRTCWSRPVRTSARRVRGTVLATGVALLLASSVAAPVTAQPLGGSSGSSGSSGAPGSSGSADSPGGPCGQSAGSSLGRALPWLTGAPDGRLPVLTGRTQAVEMMTGPGSPNDTIDRFNVSGTDLGIMWDNDGAGGARHTLIAFGDTVGDCDADGDDWRSNVLFRSSTTDIGAGIRIDSSPLDGPNNSKAIIPGFGIPGEYTVIPTAAVAVDGVQYMRVMGVQSWDEPGSWTTLYSALWTSTDNGENWTPNPLTVRANVPIDLPGVPNVDARNADFQQSAFVKPGDGFVYEYGTPSGRHGSALLARVPEADIENLAAYTYWNGTTWVPELAQAVPVIPSPVSELSVQWNDYLGKYVAMYTDATNSLVIRQADRPEGPWSGTQTILSGVLVPSLYGGFMHPWTSGQYLDFVATTWDRYNVIQFRTDLNGLQMAATDQADRPDPAVTGESRRVGTELPGGEVVPTE
ncbi:DUF4185 domain-containing protein [Rhodococcus artemisiae]|uniref:DUF4185 domain-containing protein n=1 Tax=Rhodococcus artemisiae TaxID=714159 RepID=A0ABU7L5G1_9NOCA|nr:DUF4185 domain-containing protein [Rhodococcus artemisiae]MEE2056587.1 DUF4185 domain-containing protein [Rhodococcus artemisiae]